MTETNSEDSNQAMFELTQPRTDTEDSGNEEELEKELAALLSNDENEISSKSDNSSVKPVKSYTSDTNGSGDDRRGKEEREKEEEAMQIMDSLPDSTHEVRLFEAPKTTMEALKQRLQRYQNIYSEAREQENSSKVRRFKRIIEMYEKAIKTTREGKDFDYSELANPPGYAPIPVSSHPPQQSPRNQSSPPQMQPPVSNSEVVTVKKVIPNKSAPELEEADGTDQYDYVAISSECTTTSHSKTEDDEKSPIVLTIKERLSQYKTAAVQAKSEKDEALAKYYLRVYKGIEPMLKAAQEERVVDMQQLPKPPVNKNDAVIMPTHASFDTISEAEIHPVSKRERKDVYTRLVLKLKKQLEISVMNSQHFKHTGDHQHSQLYSEIEQRARSSLNDLQKALRTNDPVPIYRTETRIMSSIVLNSELSESDLEVTVIRATGLPQPRGKDFEGWDKVESQLKLILPSTQVEPDTLTTPWLRHEDRNPEYSFTSKFQIDRSNRKLQRLVSQRSLQIEIHIKRSPRKPSEQLGSVLVKLEKVMDSTVVHNSYDVLSSRGKQVIGGKFEVMLRVREPLSEREIKVTQSEWLVMDKFIHINTTSSSKTCTLL